MGVGIGTRCNVFLTDKAIKNAELKKRPYKLSDGEGLYLLVQPTGSKLWRFKYRYFGKENTISIGKYPQVSLLEARDHRHEAKKLLRVNINPSDHKKEARLTAILDANNSFHAVALDWHALNKKNEKKWSSEHAKQIWRMLELHALPELKSRPIARIKTPELIVALRKLEKQKKLETASWLAQTFNAIFRHAVHTGILENNPASDLRGVITPPQQTHFAAIHPSALPELLAKLEAVATSMQNRIAVKFLLHVFVRPGELRYARWSEIDFDQKLWAIPTERMKKRRPHLVPLSAAALNLLGELKPLTGRSEYLFPSQQRRRHPVMSENTINHVLNHMGYKGKQVGHGFRAIASTVLNESGLFRNDVIEMQLAHIERNSSRKPYNRAEYLDERTSMMQWWSDYLEAAARNNVVSMITQKVKESVLIA